MANRYPLIINSALSQIQELAVGDNLDLSGNDISNVGNVNVSGVGTIATLNGTLATVTTGNIATVNSTLATVTTGNIATVNSTLATVTTGNIATLNGTLATVTTGNIATVNSTTINTTTINPTTVNLVRFIENVVGNGNTSGVITPNIQLGSIQTYVLTGNITLNSILNIVNGASMTIILKQDSTGGRTLTTASAFKFSGGSKTLSTAPGSVDILSIIYASTTSDYYVTLSKGYV